jgi:hypothetical protein
MEQRVFSDPSIPAYFQAANKPFKVIPHRNTTSGQVEFSVQGQGIDQALDELYSNSLVGILDYIKALKSLRSAIFALKGAQR